MKSLHILLALIGAVQITTAQLQSFEPTADISGINFGTKVAISADDILISSNTSATSPGKVYLFNTNLEQLQSFYPDDASIDDAFGETFSIENNFIAIGAPGNNAVADNSGAVYLYKKNGANYDFLQKITDAEGRTNDFFGNLVKIENNFLYISSPNDEPNDQNIDTNRGSVSVYTFNGTQWIFSQKITRNDGWIARQIIIAGEKLTITGTYYAYEYRLIEGYWIFESSYQIATMPEGDFAPIEFTYSDDQYFRLYQIETGRITLDVSDVLSNATQNIEFPELEGLVNGMDALYFLKLAVKGANLFLGNINLYYGQNQSMKYPVAYYKKVGTQWEFQTIFYGNGPEGVDDFFGASLATDNGKAVFGAPKEGNGKAYFASEAALSNDSFSKNKISVFPNPVRDILHIKNDTTEISKVEIFTVTGKLLLSFNSNPNELNLENLDSGFYFVKITTADGAQQTLKIMKALGR